jgi:hypothetical protein
MVDRAADSSLRAFAERAAETHLDIAPALTGDCAQPEGAAGLDRVRIGHRRRDRSRLGPVVAAPLPEQPGDPDSSVTSAKSAPSSWTSKCFAFTFGHSLGRRSEKPRAAASTCSGDADVCAETAMLRGRVGTVAPFLSLPVSIEPRARHDTNPAHEAFASSCAVGGSTSLGR